MDLNKNLLKKFEYSINTINPEEGIIPITILGYGEISLVFELANTEESIAYKRLPIFSSEKKVQNYVKAFNVYEKILLTDKCGLNLLQSGSYYFRSPHQYFTLFIAQEKLQKNQICHNLIQQTDSKQFSNLLNLVLSKIFQVWKTNSDSSKFHIGLDGQISNWAYRTPEDSDLTNPKSLFYLDTSTPLFRIDNKEAMDAELILKSAPPILRSLLKYLFVQEILDRYHSLRLVLIDLLANLYKEQQQKLVPKALTLTNQLLKSDQRDFSLPTIELKEIKSYYSSDKQIWILFQNSRKIFRFLNSKLMKRHYEFYLPPDIIR